MISFPIDKAGRISASGFVYCLFYALDASCPPLFLQQSQISAAHISGKIQMNRVVFLMNYILSIHRLHFQGQDTIFNGFVIHLHNIGVLACLHIEGIDVHLGFFLHLFIQRNG